MTKKSWAARVAMVAAAAVGGALVAPGSAEADNINGEIADGGTSLTLTAGSPTGAVGKIKLVSTNGDGDQQCNVDPGEEPLRLDIVTPHGITADVDPLAITACDVFHNVTFTAASDAASGTATVAILSGPAGGGTYNNNVRIPITVQRPADTSAPVITYTLTEPDGANGWHRGDAALDWTVTESESPGTLTTQGCDDVTVSADQTSTTYTCSATSAGGEASESVTIKRDSAAPAVSFGGVVSGTTGNDGWYTSAVTVRFDATDATSGVSPASQEVTSSEQGDGVVIDSPAFTDDAGNTTAAGSVSSPPLKIDTDGPTGIELTGVPSSAVHYGEVTGPAECTATDAVSGLAECAVTGLQTSVGTHTVTATATDVAGNTTTARTTYTVLPWETKGFYAPVDMTPAGTTTPVYNTVKGGSTVPLKFELFAGARELTATSAVDTFTTTKVSCVSGAAEDAIETLATTGGTSLRYDTAGGQFVQNWKVPSTAGTCYRAAMTADDGSVIRAFFKVR